MCGLVGKTGTQPYQIVLDRSRAENGDLFETHTFALVKVTRLQRRMHTSSGNFAYPIGQTIYDPNVILNSHSHALHFLPSLEAAPSYSAYGSHVLLVLPAQKLWDRPKPNGLQPAQCWHSNGCTVLCCATCLGLTPADLQQDECWRDLTIPRRHNADFSAGNGQQVLPIPRDKVWHRRVQVNPNTIPQHALGGINAW
jgi:hypothetical protein